jgi:2',3'-cyclic-nucleotide 2'-phosphodiesterase (5'-nucleotidase family)
MKVQATKSVLKSRTNCQGMRKIAYAVACPLFLIVSIAVCSVSSTADVGNRRATVLYFTDAHQLAPVVDRLGERGGAARLATVVQRVRSGVPGAVLAFGGDLAGGVLFGAVFRGQPMVEALNSIGVDVATFGQHDFDFGTDETASLVEASRFPWITSNLVDKVGKPFIGLPTTLVVERQGIRIGFIGLTDAMTTTVQDGSVKQTDLINAARVAVADLNTQGADVIIALTQTTLATNERLLGEVPEVDAVLSEERSETRSTAHFVGSRPILTPCGNLGSLIRLEIRLEEGTRPILLGGALPVDSSIPSDSTLFVLEQEYAEKLERRLAEQLATLEVPLDAGVSGNAAARFQETNAGNLIADAFRDHHEADIGIMNGGGIRANAPRGAFTLREALSLLPYGNRVCLVEIRGATLLRALEHGVSRVAQRTGAFCQVSGVRYTYNPEKPAGSRVIKAEVKGKKVDESRLYRVALPSFILTGGDGFTMLKNAQVLVGPKAAPEDVVVLADYCRKLGRVDYRIEGRINISSSVGGQESGD